MRRTVFLAAAALMTATVTARAADGPPESVPPAPVLPSPDSPSEKAKQGLELLLEAIKGWVRQIPSYAAPEITPEGDIVIRRLDRDPPPPTAAPADPAPNGKSL